MILLFACSIDKVSKVKSPVLVIHGTEDEVIDFSHGMGIYESCPKAVEPLWVEVSWLFIVLLRLFTLKLAGKVLADNVLGLRQNAKVTFDEFVSFIHSL